MDKTLFSRDKYGHIVEWNITVYRGDGESWNVRRTWGVQGGKMQETVLNITEGKSKRSVQQQAILQAESFYKKRIDGGDTPDVGKLDDYIILPMLAHSWEKRGNPTAIYDCQPKLDGVRAMFNCKHGFITRMGKKITSVPHITKAIEISEDTWLDGELYTSKLNFESLSGIVRRLTPCPESEQVEFHIFDCYLTKTPDANWRDRLKYIESIHFNTPLVKVVPTLKNVKGSVVDRLVDDYVKYGHEGLIARNPEGVYCLNERSASLLKHKRFHDSEYLVVGASEGKGRDTGTIVWECITPEEKRFSVRPEGTHEHRQELWKNWRDHIGKKLTVRYQELTRLGIPRFPVGVALRDYEE